MHSFRNRLLVLITALLVITQTVTLVAFSLRVVSSVKTRAGDQLSAGGKIVQQFMQFRGSELAGAAHVLAGDFGFREAVAYNDRATIVSVLENHAKRIHATLSLLIDPEGKLVAATAPIDAASSARLATLLDHSPGNRDRPHFLVVNGRVYQFCIEQVSAPEIIAWVALGFAVDDALAHELQRMVGADVTLIAHTEDQRLTIVSTMAAAQRAALTQRIAASGPMPKQPATIELASESHLAAMQPIESGGGEVWAALSMSMRDAMAPFREVRSALVVIAAGALLFAVGVSALLWRAARRPIDQLVQGVKRIEEGDYTQRMVVRGGEEFERLATTLNAMQEGIAEREARIIHQAHHDALTGLPNRLLTGLRLATLVAAARSAIAGVDLEVALILIDLGDFRAINSSLGHQVGDQALVEIAARLKRNTRSRDFVARVAATQFLVAIGDCPREYALRLAEQLCRAAQAGVRVDHATLTLDAATGVCFAPEHGQEPSELLRRAEVALQDARDRRMSCAVFEPQRDIEHRRRLVLVVDLRAAIDSDALTLVYQPKARMATHRIESAEALVRWTHPALGPVAPAEFVPLAEQAGYSRALTRWVARRAVQQMAEWLRAGIEIDVAVNLSAPDIVDPEFTHELLAELERYAVPGSALLLEITESAVVRDPESAVRNMDALRLAGIRFAIDDFGTGHSSLSQLQRLPVDELKIDRSFVMHAHERRDDAAIVRSTIELAHSMGLRVVAEGVETGEIWTLLLDLGCDYAQGYFLSGPVAASQLPGFIAAVNAKLEDAASPTSQVRTLEGLLRRRSDASEGFG
ncbi:MAG: EAL domain-containing protein [Steroidobacteraceae bacterium]